LLAPRFDRTINGGAAAVLKLANREAISGGNCTLLHLAQSFFLSFARRAAEENHDFCGSSNRFFTHTLAEPIILRPSKPLLTPFVAKKLDKLRQPLPLSPRTTRYRFVLPLFLALVAPFAVTGSSIGVSASGQFGSTVTADTLAAPGGTWDVAFDVDTMPAVSNQDALGFDAVFSNFTYMVNGMPIAFTPDEIRFYTTAGGGLFTLFFGPETGFQNGRLIPEFTFSGSQVFSGTTTSPTILAGDYSVSDVIYSDNVNYDDEGAAEAVAIGSGSTTVGSPEPSTFGLLLVAAVALLCRRRRVCATWSSHV
jgi:hypothetical protein